MQSEIIVELFIDSNLNGQKYSIAYSHIRVLALYSRIPYVIILGIRYTIILPIPYTIKLPIPYTIILHLPYTIILSLPYIFCVYFIPSFSYLIVYTMYSAFILHLLYANLTSRLDCANLARTLRLLCVLSSIMM